MYKGPEQIKVECIGLGIGRTLGKIYEAKAATEREGVNCHYRIDNDLGQKESVGVLPNRLKAGWSLVKEE